MLKSERMDQVLNILKSRKFCTVEELVSELHYSPATIRRDLTALAQMGLVNKSYGGASFSGAKPLLVREHEGTNEKRLICQAAHDLVHDGDIVFVDGTSTTYFLRDILVKRKNLTVVTTNLKLAIDLCERSVNCFVPGGRLCDTAMLGGPLAAETLERFSFSVSFFSPGSVTRRGGFDVSESFLATMQTVLRNSKQKVCLYHKGKFGLYESYYLHRLDTFNTVISSVPFPEHFATSFPNTKFILAK